MAEIGRLLGGMFTGGMGPLLSGLGGLLGGFSDTAEWQQGMSDINNNTNFRDQYGSTGFGNFNVGAGGQNNFTFNPQMQAMQAMLQNQSMGQLQGGLFNDQNFQNAFGNNDMAGALGQAQGALQQQAGNTAFGGLQGLFNQNAGLSNQFAQQTAAGPQDLTGGLMGNLLGQGFQNQLAAGDQSGLYNQSLDRQRAAATNGGLLDLAINKFTDRAHSTGRDAFSAFGNDQRAFLNSISDQDLGFQNNAFGKMQQQQNFLGNLGAQQIGQGAGFLGQNLGQFNQGAQFANMFGGAAAGLEGQQFGQGLAGLQQNQSAGNQRLQNAMGLFGQGTDVFNQSFAQGLGGMGQQLGYNDQALSALLGFRNAEANRIGATGMGSQAIAEMNAGGGSGIGDFIGGLFSDKRLKDNLVYKGKVGELNWYTWDWNDEAKRIGADKDMEQGFVAQEVQAMYPNAVNVDEETGYLKINRALALALGAV